MPFPPKPFLGGALVQEADCADGVVVLKVRVPGRTSLLLVGAARTSAAAGLLPATARQELWGGRLPPGSTRQRAREDALQGARVLALGPAEIHVDQHGVHRVLRATGGRVVITDATAPCDETFVGASEDERSVWETRGTILADALADDVVEVRRAAISRALGKARLRIERRQTAIRSDLRSIDRADQIASQAQWLVAEAKKAPRGATELVVTDWSSGEGVPIVVPLDPARGAREQVDAMFKRSKRLRLGARIAHGRLAQADAQHAAIVLQEQALASAASLLDIEEIARIAKRSAPRDFALPQGAPAPGAATSRVASASTGRSGTGKRTPYRTFCGESGRKILVGKGAADNDELTLKVAKPHDLWLHAKGHTGAHVIVHLDKGHTCPAEDLVDAAHLAAHFSDARDERAVDVSVTPRRYVRKPKGSPPGLVVVDREKILALRVDPEAIRRLLEREET